MEWGCLWNPTVESWIAEQDYTIEGLASSAIDLEAVAGVELCRRAYTVSAVVYVVLLACGLFYCLKQLLCESHRFSMHKEVLQACFFGIVLARICHLALVYLQACDPLLMDIVFLVPPALSFVSCTALFVTWFDALAFVAGKGKEGASRVFYAALAFDSLVLAVALVLLCLDARLSSLPIIVGTFCFALVSLKQLFVRWRNDKVRWDGATARQFSGLTRWVLRGCSSALLIATIQLAFGLCIYLFRANNVFLAEQLLWTVSEVLLLISILGVLSNLSFVTNLTSPKSASEVTSDWITRVLQESNTISDDVVVAKFPLNELEQLRGGCHSDVRKLALEYEGGHGCSLSYRDLVDAPATVVVKFLCWQKPFWHKLKVFATYKLPGMHSKEADYVKSYKIESYFYDWIAREVKGIQLPRIYFNYADTFNVHFGVVMEDVTRGDGTLGGGVGTGQPHGFTFDETRVIFRKLALFHAHFWQDSSIFKFHVWNIGGFWTGDKRDREKATIVSAWEKVFALHGDLHKSYVNGGSSPPLSASHEGSSSPQLQASVLPSAIGGPGALSVDALASLGQRLERNAREIKKVYTELCSRGSSFLTLIHGDFKISNVFIDDRASARPVRNSLSLPKTCDSDERNVWTIDWQWVGRGIAAIDVAYFLCTSTRPDMISRSAFKKQVRMYYSVVLERGVKGISHKELWCQVRLCVIDFVVYCIVSKWCNMSLEDFENNQAECKDGMQVRSLQHMHRLLEVTVTFLDDLGFR